MDTDFIERNKQRLLDLKEELKEDLADLRGLTREGIDETEVKDRIEVASINMSRKTNMAEINLLERRLDEIDAALQAIADGTYGTCERCGKTIQPERLEANPSATLCIDCQRIVDAE